MVMCLSSIVCSDAEDYHNNIHDVQGERDCQKRGRRERDKIDNERHVSK